MILTIYNLESYNKNMFLTYSIAKVSQFGKEGKEMKKCIVFDVDRTIVDSYKPELVSLQEAIENVTNRKIGEEEMKKLTSLPTVDFFKHLDLSDEEIDLVNKEWEITYSKNKTKCFPGIKRIITDLYNSGYIICVITSRTAEEFHELDEELNSILYYFKLVVTSDLVKSPKPNIESMTHLCKELELSEEDIIYIGDNEIDKEFAQNCNICFIPACWENKELKNEENACLSIDDLMNIIDNYRLKKM